MKKGIFQKTISLILSGTMMFLSAHLCLSESITSEAASNKARVSVHDPSIIKANDGTYYVWGSHIDAAKSKDLQNWTQFTNGYTTPNNAEFGDLSANLKKAFDWAGENLEDCDASNPNSSGFAVWAPDVVWNPEYIN